MEFSLTNQLMQHFDGDCAVVFAFCDSENKDLNIQAAVELNHFDAKAGNAMILNNVSGFKTNITVVLGLGELPVTAKNYQKALKSLYSKLKDLKVMMSKLKTNYRDHGDDGWVADQS